MAIQLIITEPSIGNTDQTGRIDENAGMTWDLEQGLRGTAKIPLRVFPGDPYKPTIGSPVFIKEIISGVPKQVWAGKIMQVNRKWTGNQGCNIDTISCSTLDSYFDTIEVYPPQYFDNMTCGAILTAIFNAFCSTCPITLGTIEDGPTITVAYTHRETIRDVFEDLKTKADKIWGIRNADQKLYFQDSDTTIAPHVLTTFQYDTGSWDEDQTDYRNEQTIRISFNAFTPSCEMFDGDETTEFFNMTNRVDRIVSAMITNSVRASVTASFPGSPASLPHDGDTFTISRPGFTAIPYTWVNTLDNTQLRQVKIATTLEDCAHNAVDAILALPFHAGITFSLPTWQNEFCIAEFPTTGSSTFTVRVKFPGSGGNIVTLAATGTSMVWSSSGCTGGTDGDTNSALRFSVVGSGTLGDDLQYTPGSNVVSANAAIQGGVSLLIAYYRSGADCITVRDSVEVAARAAAENGPGIYARLTNDTNNSDARAAYIKALSILNQFKTIPKIFECDTLRPEYEPGQLLTITVTSPTGASSDLNGLWLLQHVQGKIVAGMDKLAEPYGHFWYTIKVLSVNQIGTKVAFWETLALTAPSGSQSVSNQSTAVATPKLTAPGSSPAGTPATGAPTTTAGQQWVQEQLGPATEQAFNDLVVDGSNPDLVSSASYAFVSGDVGKKIQTFAGGAWTDASADIVSVAGGKATTATSLAATGSTGGHWRLFDPKVFGFTWTPTRSTFTNNQVAAIIKLKSDGASPPTYTSEKLRPFDKATVGYDLSGSVDYVITGNNLALSVTPDPTDIFIAEYFPSGPKRIPPTPPPPSDPNLFVVAHDDGASAGDIVMTSPDGVTWTSRNTPLPDSGKTVAFGAGVYVLGADFTGTTEQIATSADGITWALQSSPADNATVDKVIFAGSQFVAIYHSGSTGGVMTSPDGITWTARTPSASHTWTDIAYSGSIYVVVGNGNTTDSIMSSPDGVTWTNRTTSAVPQFTCVAFGAGIFVALGGVGGSGIHLWTSSDGMTWTSQSDPGGDNRIWNGVCFGGSQFVAVTTHGSTPQAMTSNDGITWTLQATPSTRNWQAVAYGSVPALYVAVANQSASTSLAVMTSADGITWTTRTTPSAGFCRGVTFG